MYVDRPEPDESRMTCLCLSEGCPNIVQQPVWLSKRGVWGYYRFCCACTHLKHKFGLTVPDRQKLLDEQGGVCKICKYEISFPGIKHHSSDRKHAVLDHCHNSLKVRGVLCGNCNIMIGKAMDQTDILRNAIKYLDDNKS